MYIPLTQAAKMVAGSAFLTGLGALFYAGIIEPKRFKLEKVRIATGSHSQAGQSVNSRSRTWRILHISDLHLCYPEAEKVEFLKKVTQADYDLVILTGDIFENFTGLAYATQILSRPPKLGAFAVLGNHDYYNYTIFHKTAGRMDRRFRHPSQKRDVEPMVRALTRGGFQVLRNQAVHLPGHGMQIIGIDYPGVNHFELQKLQDGLPETDFRLILFHMPVYLEAMEKAGAHLALGGHTHGGQIRLPGIGALVTDSELPAREACGLFFRGKTAFHISRGLGADPRSNIRFLCPPAATVIEITHARQPAGNNLG